MYGHPGGRPPRRGGPVRLADDRMAVKSAIRRASRRAQDDMRRLDRTQIDQLEGIYRRAVDEIGGYLAARAGDDDTLRITVMRELLAQAEVRMDSLARERDALLGTGLREAATLGTVPWAADPAIGADLTRIADEAVRFVTRFVADDGLQLSDRIWSIDQHGRDVVRDAIQRSIIEGHSASQAALDFVTRGEPVPAALRTKAQQATPGRVGRVLARELMTGEGSPYANALRLFRTEINRAHGEAYQAAAFEDPAVIGTRFVLSPNHPRVDICDLHASVNLYGLGPGVYPKGKNPWPAHPNTLSFVEVVFDDEVGEADRAGREDRIGWLQAQPAAVQSGVLGQAKAKALRRGVLPANAITTPWRVVKVRLQRQGIDIDD